MSEKNAKKIRQFFRKRADAAAAAAGEKAKRILEAKIAAVDEKVERLEKLKYETVIFARSLYEKVINECK